MKIRQFGEPLLRKPALKAKLADSVSQYDAWIGPRHRSITRSLTTMSLHTISVISLLLSRHGQLSILKNVQNTVSMSSLSTVRLPSIGVTDTSLGPRCAEPESLSQVGDEALISKHASGNPGALSELFKRYATLVRSVGKKILRSDYEADDLVQEVFLYLHRKSRLFDCAKGTGRSWIVQIAYTQAFLRRRALKAHGFYLPETASKQVDSGRAPNAGGHGYDLTLEGLFGRNGRKKIAKQLTEDQRQTLRLHFFEGLTFAEIAEKLGQSHRNIRNHHYRGLEKLRKYMVKSKGNVV